MLEQTNREQMELRKKPKKEEERKSGVSVEILHGDISAGKLGPDADGNFKVSLIINLGIVFILEDEHSDMLANVFAEIKGGRIVYDDPIPGKPSLAVVADRSPGAVDEHGEIQKLAENVQR